MTFNFPPEAFLLLSGGIIAMLGAAFFASSEIALISCDKSQLRRLKERKMKRAEAALKLLENIDQLLTTTQFGANFSTALATTLLTIFTTRYLNAGDNGFVGILFAMIFLIFADSMPKVLGRHRSDRISLLVALPLITFQRIFWPPILIVSSYTKYLSKLIGVGYLDALAKRKKVRDELHALLQDTDNDSDIRLGQRRIIRKILDFSQKNVKKVMIPLVNVDAIANTCSIEDAIETFERLRHSRLPIYSERIDNIVGILHFQDIFESAQLIDNCTKHMRPALYVPEHQLLEALTGEMKNKDAQIAIVVDEYGGAVGLVTKEDVLEELVGNISDEFDEHQLTYRQIDTNSYLVHVNMDISEINERFELHIPKGEYETLSGFLLQQFNRIPEPGDELHFSGVIFRVHKANERSIQTVILQVNRKQEIIDHE